MKVVCISTKGIVHPSMQNVLVVGNEYTIVGKSLISDDHVLIQEHLSIGGQGCAWYEGLFAPLSEIDERNLAHAEPIESTFKLIEL